ncbi:MAG: MotA/TolQ/ExbB proton channel family protein [Deltaproteobacteria bacterium]|nr:MotA/TolQ/ExbB proton channel family protein [Deltaproteobacteria bacterium]
MIAFILKGGILVIPILACSVLALAIFLERVIRFSLMKSRGAGLAEKVVAALESGEDGVAEKIAEQSRSPMGRVLKSAIAFKGHDREILETVLVHATDQEVRGLSQYIQALATIGNIAPLLGLLGTVMGMIKAFMVIQDMGGRVNSAVLAGGIWEAMITTALGLSVALPVMLAHSYLLARVDRYEARLTHGAVVFLTAVATRNKDKQERK